MEGVVAAGLEWDTTRLIFTPQSSCPPAQTLSATLFNQGAATRMIYFASIQSPFVIKEIKQGSEVKQLPVPLDSNKSLTFTLEFTPRDPGEVTGSLVLFTDDPAVPNPTLPLKGEGTGPFFKVDVTSLAFGTQPVGSTAFQNVRVSNPGNATFSFRAIAPTQPFSVELASAPGPLPAAIPVAPGGFENLKVSFQPTASGSFLANLALQSTTTPPCPQLLVVSLEGTAQVVTNLSATPSTLNFGPQRVGFDSAEHLVTVRNISTSAVTLTRASSSPNFTVVSSTPTLPHELEPGKDLVIKVKFSPVNELTSSGTLTLTASGQAGTFEVPLQGVGVRPLLTFSPATLEFAPQRAGTTSIAKAVTVRNERAFEVKGLTASALAPFQISPRTFDLPANGTFPLQVVFSPTTTNSGQVLGSVTVSSMSSEPQFSLPLQGSVVNTQLTLNPGKLEFGDLLVKQSASRKITLTNPSPLDVTLYDVPVAPPFSIALPPTPQGRIIPANGGSLTLDVSFSPLTRKSYTQSVTLSSDATVTNPVLELSGKAIGPVLALSPVSLSFPNKVVGGQYSENVILTNSGDAEVQVTPVVSAPFRVQGLPAGTSLGPNGQITFQVIFAPTTLNPADETLSFTSVPSTPSPTLRLTGSATGPLPEFSPPAEHDFGAIHVAKACSKTDTSFNPNKPKEVTISNGSTATAPLKIQGITTNPPYSLILPANTPAPTPTSPLILQPGVSLAVDVCFVPPRESSRSSPDLGALKIAYEGSTVPKEIKLSGWGAMPKLKFDQPAVDFEEVPLGQSLERDLILSNPGDLPVKLTKVISTDPLFYFRGLTWPKVLNPTDQVEFTVGFLPKTDGSFSANLQVETENLPIIAFPLSGTGASPKAVLSLSNHEFGRVAVRSASEPITVTLSNKGTAELLFNGATTTGDFTVDVPLPTGWPVKIAPEQGYDFTVRFEPLKAGVLTGTLSLSTNAQATALTVPLQGTGVGAVETAPASLDFGSANVGEPSRVSFVTVSNNTVNDVTITSITSSNPDEFALMPPPPPNTLVAANGFKSIPISFRPRALGPRTATLAISLPGGPQSVTLTGVGTSPELELSPAGVMDFGGVKLNTPSAADAGRLTIINRGGPTSGPDGGYPGVVTLSRVALSGADSAHFELGQLPLPQDLQPGAQLEVPVTFRPTRQGALTASLFLTTGPLSGDGGVSGNTRTVTLAGTGLASVLEFSSRKLDFGMQVGGRTSESKSFTITNRGGRLLKLKMDVEGEQFSHFTMLVTDEFTGASKSPPYALEGGSTVKVSVKFTPLAGVTSNAQVHIYSDDEDESVPLKGIGMSSDLEVDVTSLAVDFGTVLAPSDPGNVSRFLTVTNKSTQDVTLKAPTLEGFNPDHFEVLEQWQAGLVLSANQRATLKVGYRAQEAASSQATLVVSTTKSTSDQALRVSLSGRTVTNFLSVTPMELDFGFVDLGGQSDPMEVTVTNEARVERLVRIQSVDPAFEVDASQLTSALQPGKSATLSVTFHPTVGGPSSSQLRLHLQGEDSADVVLELRGQGRTLQGEGGGCACGSGGGGSAVLGMLLLCLRAWRRGRASRALPRSP
jgi:hypothetical protein